MVVEIVSYFPGKIHIHPVYESMKTGGINMLIVTARIPRRRLMAGGVSVLCCCLVLVVAPPAPLHLASFPLLMLVLAMKRARGILMDRPARAQ